MGGHLIGGTVLAKQKIILDQKFLKKDCELLIILPCSCLMGFGPYLLALEAALLKCCLMKIAKVFLYYEKNNLNKLFEP